MSMSQETDVHPNQSDENEIKDETLARIEAFLFIHGSPVSFDKIAALLGVTREQAEKSVDALSDRYAQDNQRGIYCIKGKDDVTLATKPAYASILEQYIKEELKEELTPAALETLSLIAYLGPISRPQVDFIRGVNSSFIVRNLLVRGLIERSQGKGNAYDYHVTTDFLRFMGVGSVKELPEYARYQELKKTYLEQNAQEQEISATEKTNQSIA